jgi:hypothetical protein
LTLAYLESLKNALLADAGINGMVDGKIYKFRPLEKSEPDLRSAVHKSLISCELKDWAGGKTSSDPVFIVDIRSRQGTDGGAEYCSEIAKAVKELLDDGFSGVVVSQIQGEVKFEKALVAYRCRLEVFGHIKVSYSLSLYPSLASPQPAGTDVVFTAVASPAEGLEYRFLLQGPGTGLQWRDLSGWMSRNSLSWTASEQDVGSSTIKVQIRGGKNRVEQDAETTASYTITAASGGSGSLPVISGLYPSLASPRSAGTKVDFICVASDADNDPLLYRFILLGPGTASQAKIVQDWSARNAWSWTPADEDVGLSTIEVQVRDGKHAGPGSYDAHTSISYTISSNIKPAISSLTASLASPQLPGQEIELICTASDAEGNELLYKFWLTGPGTGGVARDMTGWISRNSFTWKPGAEDVGNSTIKVQVRDSKHSSVGSYDDQASLSYTINAATVGTNSLPTIVSLTPNLPSPQKQDQEIKFVCIAADADGDEILYRFAIIGPGTGSKLQDVTGWQKQNSLTWKPAKEDIGTSTIYAYIRDGEHAGQGGYDAQASLSYTIVQAVPTISAFTPSLASPQPPGLEIELVCTASDADGNELLYRFWHQPPGVSYWKDLSGWTARNWVTWKPTLADSGTNGLKVQVIDGKHAEKGGYDAASTISYTIAP